MCRWNKEFSEPLPPRFSSPPQSEKFTFPFLFFNLSFINLKESYFALQTVGFTHPRFSRIACFIMEVYLSMVWCLGVPNNCWCKKIIGLKSGIESSWSSFIIIFILFPLKKKKKNLYSWHFYSTKGYGNRKVLIVSHFYEKH